MPEYIITRPARQDIDQIYDYIAADNVDSAISFDQRLIALFEILGQNPHAARLRPELQEGTRSFAYGHYVILYRIWAGDAAIVRVLHSSRDFRDMLDE